MPKHISIIAGPNGAGKTTFAGQMIGPEIPFLNADNIAARLCPEAPESVAIQAGRVMLEEVRRRLELGEEFALETTLSGRIYAKGILEWQARGFTVGLAFLRLPDADTAVNRVANRVRQGGHAIPVKVIRRRFEVGWRNFENLYKPLVDAWAVYDSFQTPPKLLEKGIKS